MLNFLRKNTFLPVSSLSKGDSNVDRTLQSTAFAENALLGQTELLEKLSQNWQRKIQPSNKTPERLIFFILSCATNFHFFILKSFIPNMRLRYFSKK